MSGPLAGLRVLEVGGIGPVPFCGMVLSDLGAEVVRLHRISSAGQAGSVLERGRRSVGIDIKRTEAVEVVLKLAERSDVLIEGHRPGVMERLGLGPETCLSRNPRLIYARMTGWGQDGPLAGAAGHDINYIALSGALFHIGERGGKPTPPLNLVGDFGGGGMLLAMGVLASLCERSSSGVGQVIDAAMLDGSALLMATWFDRLARNEFRMERGTNVLDGSAPHYGVYETADGGYISIGSLEPDFYSLLLNATNLGDSELGDKSDWRTWPDARQRLANVFRQKTRDEWCALLEGTDVCFAPVLSAAEAPEHRHNKARSTFVEVNGVRQPAPAPRFSRTPAGTPLEPPIRATHTGAVLAELGMSEEQIRALRRDEVVA